MAEFMGIEVNNRISNRINTLRSMSENDQTEEMTHIIKEVGKLVRVKVEQMKIEADEGSKEDEGGVKVTYRKQ